MLITKIESPNQKGVRALGEKENFKYLAILEADIIKHVEMKEKIRDKKPLDERKRFLKPSSVAEISSKRTKNG